MTRYIDADALTISVLKKAMDDAFLNGNADMHRLLIQVIAHQPTADAEPVRHGKWIPHEDEDGEHYGDKCSECGEWYVMPYGKTNFCPHCGARMDAERKEE